MARIRCNQCGQIKSINNKSYLKMLENFKIKRGFLLGMFRSFEAILSDGNILDMLSDEEMEKKFIETYVCKECKNRKVSISQKLKQIQEVISNAGR